MLHLKKSEKFRKLVLVSITLQTPMDKALLPNNKKIKIETISSMVLVILPWKYLQLRIFRLYEDDDGPISNS